MEILERKKGNNTRRPFKTGHDKLDKKNWRY